MSSFQMENDILVNRFLKDTFFKSFNADNPSIDNLKSVEIQINSVCDLSCKYCYYTNFGKELYPVEISGYDTIMKNLEALLLWFRDNNMNPDIDMFTGEIFTQKVGRDALSFILDFYRQTPKRLRPNYILIPTNYTFMLQPELIRFAEDIIFGFTEIGINVGFSASFDGKLLESHNRPMKAVILHGGEDPRGDAYYDEIFKFNSHFGFGFHPMVYANKIELWKENFLWFQENFEKHGISWDNIYLLEVRNAEWTSEQIKAYGDFLRFLIQYSWEKCGRDIDTYKDFLNRGRGFNTLSSSLGRIGRGIGCSIQSMLYIRLGDLTLAPCHRTMYPGFQTVKFKKVDDRIVGFESINPELMIATYQMEAATQPYCEQCAINTICAKGCLGAQLEVMGDMFTPIPTVCALEFAKIYAMADEYRSMGILDEMLQDRGEIEDQFKAVLRLYDDENNMSGGN